MATINWKVLSLLTVLLLIALGLQAGALKIMINLAGDSNAAAALAAAKVARHSAPTPERQTHAETAVSAPEVKATPPVTEAPPVAEATPKPAVSKNEPSPEAPKLAITPPPAVVQPSAEAALIAAEAKLQSLSPANISQNPPNRNTANSPEQAAKPNVIPPANAVAAAEVSATPEAMATSTLQEPAWLKNRNPKHYTVQLYSGKDMGTLKEIAASTVATEPQAYYSTGTRSGTWYSLVAGDYPDSASAQAAADKLTTRSPALKPWIRRFDDIQAKLR